ncbi:AI-2E family transporter [Thermococcus sp.]
MKLESIAWTAFIGLVLYVSWRLIEPLVTAMFFGLITAYAVYPLHKRLSQRYGSRNSALVITLIMLFFATGLTVELILIFGKLITSFYGDFTALAQWLKGFPLPLGISQVINNFFNQLGPNISKYISAQAFSIPSYLLQLVVFFFVVYYSLRYSREIRRQIEELFPRKYEGLGKDIISSVDITLHALIRAWLLLNIAKGFLMAIGFLIFGVSDIYTAIIVGLLTIIFSFVPLLEGWMFWAGAAIYFYKVGALWKAIGISIYGAALVSPLPDYTIRPVLVAKEAKLDETIVFIGMVGGIWAFGMKGALIGPIILNVMLTLLRKWKELTKVQSSAA